MASTNLAAFEERAQKAEALVQVLQARVAQVRDMSEAHEIKMLTAENAKLQAEIEKTKAELANAELANGKAQVALPGEPGYTAPTGAPAATSSSPPAPAQNSNAAAGKVPTGSEQAPKAKKEKKKKGDGGGGYKRTPKAAPVAAVLDVTRLDLRVGRVVTAKVHPEADGAYLEDVETGEENNRVVISGLAGKVPLEEMQDRMVCLCMNLKPRKIRGIESQAMVMCANVEDEGVTKIEVIDPPAGAVPGDIITVEGFSAPDKLPDKQLNPKKKVLEALLPDLFTDDKGVATYKGVPWAVEGKGVCTVKSLFKAGIK